MNGLEKKKKKKIEDNKEKLEKNDEEQVPKNNDIEKNSPNIPKQKFDEDNFKNEQNLEDKDKSL